MATNPRETRSGESLLHHRSALAGRPLRELLATPGRVGDMTLRSGSVVIDLSRSRADATTLTLLTELVDELDIPAQLRAMCAGERVNHTEDRPALHTALRLPPEERLVVDGHDIAREVQGVYQRIDDFVTAVHSGKWRGGTGERITSVVNIGIGGSDLGPRMVTRALRRHHLPGIDVRFVANVDPADLTYALAGLRPENTLFVVVSKTFTTVETLANARAARDWITQAMNKEAVAQHMVAVTAATSRAVEFGVSDTAVFGFWDWVGGRFSVSSPVGLAIELAVGPESMREFRAGMRSVDEDLLNQPARDNGAVMLGMLDVWYSTFCDYTSRAVVPYSQDLELLPAHLQQLQMESNGKSTTFDGEPVTWRTSPSVWGTSGTNGQHAYFQLLHQGTEVIPVDFIGVLDPQADERSLLVQANLLAQASALAIGRTAAEVSSDHVDPDLVAHRTMPGNRPSSLLLLPDSSPRAIGQLIALYEHRTVVAGLAWGINPFDQWGVELGKQLANALLPALSGEPLPPGSDAATAATLKRMRSPSA